MNDVATGAPRAGAALRIDADRLWRSLMDLAQIGATPLGGVRRITLTDVPGRLLSSSRMPLVDGPAPDGNAKQTGPGQVELEVGGSPVYLVLGR